MSTVRVIPQPAAIAKLIMTGGAVAKVACHAPAVVKFVSVGTQGSTGQTGPAGNDGADLNGYDPGDINLMFENSLI